MTEEKQPKSDGRRRPERKVEILQAVMGLLETANSKVTTAALAERVGLSEAALYRHFKGKDAIFAALVEYIEGHLLKPAGKVLHENEPSLNELGLLFEYHLRFFANHPGLCRIFLVEGIAAESDAVAEQMVQVVRKYTTQIKQILRRLQTSDQLSATLPVEAAALHFVGIIQARTLRYVLSGFKELPYNDWEVSWTFYLRAIHDQE